MHVKGGLELVGKAVVAGMIKLGVYTGPMNLHHDVKWLQRDRNEPAASQGVQTVACITLTGGG